jgi:hypothetical protein
MIKEVLRPSLETALPLTKAMKAKVVSTAEATTGSADLVI